MVPRVCFQGISGHCLASLWVPNSTWHQPVFHSSKNMLLFFLEKRSLNIFDSNINKHALNFWGWYFAQHVSAWYWHLYNNTVNGKVCPAGFTWKMFLHLKGIFWSQKLIDLKSFLLILLLYSERWEPLKSFEKFIWQQQSKWYRHCNWSKNNSVWLVL